MKLVLFVTPTTRDDFGDGEEQAVESDEAERIIGSERAVEERVALVVGQGNASSCQRLLLALQNGKEEVKRRGVARNRGVFEPQHRWFRGITHYMESFHEEGHVRSHKIIVFPREVVLGLSQRVSPALLPFIESTTLTLLSLFC